MKRKIMIRQWNCGNIMFVLLLLVMMVGASLILNITIITFILGFWAGLMVPVITFYNKYYLNVDDVG